MRFVVYAEGTVWSGGEIRAGTGCRVFVERREAENFFLFTTIRISGGERVRTGADVVVALERSRLVQVEAESEDAARAIVRSGEGRSLLNSRRYEIQEEAVA